MKGLLRWIAITMLLLGLTQAVWAEGKVVEGAVNAGEKAAEEMPKADVKHGKKIFDSICTHCHRTDYETSPVGAPGLRDVLQRHTAEWINTWVTSPEAFSKKDKDAKALVESNSYGLIMPTLPEMQVEQNRKDVIEYLKTLK